MPLVLRAVALAVFLLAPSAKADFRYVFDSENSRWRLSNGLIEAIFQLTPSGTFEFQSLTGLQGEGTWTAPIARPSSAVHFSVDRVYYNAHTRFQLVNQYAIAVPNKRAYRQVIVLKDLEGKMQLTVNLAMYEGQPVLRHWLQYTNLQPNQTYVTYADMLGWALADEAGTYRTFRINQWGIIPQAVNFEPLEDVLDPSGIAIPVVSGSRGANCSWVAFMDQNGKGLFAGWEFDGRTEGSVTQSSATNDVQISAQISQINHAVGPGETFSIPAGFIGVFRDSWDNAGFRTQSFVESALAKAAPDQGIFPYVAWDSWGYQSQLNEDTLRRNAALAASMGFELFTVDLGWANKIGDWHDDRTKFPSGLRALSDYVHSLGMKFGLHLAFAEAAPDSQVLSDHPDWTSSKEYYYFGAKSLCLSNRETRDWVVSETVRVIDDYGVDWILQDGENMVKECTKTTHTHDPNDSNYANAVEGLNAVVSAVQQARPKVSWENCADGGTMMTYNMVKQYVTSITNDASGVFDSRRAAYGATYPFPPRYADRYMTDQTLDKYTTRSFMFGGPWIFMNRLPDLTSDNADLAKSEIQVFKNMRDHVRNSQVYHIDPPTAGRIDAIQAYNSGKGSAVVLVTRDGGNVSTYNLTFRGLVPDTTYLIGFQEDHRLLTLTGLQLMRSGITVNLPEQKFSEIVYATPVQVE